MKVLPRSIGSGGKKLILLVSRHSVNPQVTLAPLLSPGPAFTFQAAEQTALGHNHIIPLGTEAYLSIQLVLRYV